MEKYFKRLCKSHPSSSQQTIDETNVRIDDRNVIEEIDMGLGDDSDDMNDIDSLNESADVEEIDVGDDCNEMNDINVGEARGEINVEQLTSDLGLRKSINKYDVNVRDIIRREYVQRGPCQLRNHEFVSTKKRNKDRRFSTKCDESEDSTNQGNFLQLLKWLCDHNPKIKAVCLKNAPENFKLTSPNIQKDIVSVITFETTRVIISEIGDGLFSIPIDESRDISTKEKMSIVLRYVKDGYVMERFVGIQHVSSITALSLKVAIDDLFSRYSLSLSNLRGQCYDGASNMQGEYNGLKTLILKDNPSAYYIHCFAHQLQLALLAVAKKHADIQSFYYLADSVVNVVGGSAKRCDLIREKQGLKILEALNVGEISSGRGLNQETAIKRSGDTHWGSHYGCLCNLMLMFSTTIEVY
ncbi:General transcription factor 2-related zinc finger protein [Abeliophyllum distichum]|uniref:General transcription factor 2-related zinc finger protein n=1 Tax=Abeliophyllum distichum TaxID=126358 RepID=A0ABD1NW91_9LAMI